MAVSSLLDETVVSCIADEDMACQNAQKPHEVQLGFYSVSSYVSMRVGRYGAGLVQVGNSIPGITVPGQIYVIKIPPK